MCFSAIIFIVGMPNMYSAAVDNGKSSTLAQISCDSVENTSIDLLNYRSKTQDSVLLNYEQQNHIFLIARSKNFRTQLLFSLFRYSALYRCYTYLTQIYIYFMANLVNFSIKEGFATVYITTTIAACWTCLSGPYALQCLYEIHYQNVHQIFTCFTHSLCVLSGILLG